MAEALAVVGVVSSIVGLVDFGSKVLHRLNDFQSSRGEIPETFKHIKDELPILLETLHETKVAVEKGSIKEETKKALLLVVNGCQTQITLLDNLIARSLPQEEYSWRKKAGKAIFSIRQDAKVNKIMAILRTHIQSLTYYRVATSSTLQTASDTRPTPSSTVPFRRDRDFVHREILSGIQIRCSQPASRVALVGLGGVGKSQLAIEYSYQVRESSPNTWVFWVHASSAARFEEGYRKIAQRVKISGWDNPEVNILQLVNNWLCDEANGRWFMVMDNADDASVFLKWPYESKIGANSNKAALSEALPEYLPQSQNGSMLVTSRSRDVAFRITGDTRDIIPVNPMDEGVAADLLRKKLQGDFDENDAKRLLHALDYMPLAITQAAAFINQRSPHTTISKYLQDLQKSDTDRARLLNKHVADTRRDGKASNSIITTWQISFENICKERPSASQLLSLMCLFDRQGIPKSLLNGHYQELNEIENDSEADFEDDIYTLCSYSLIGTDADATEFEMHQLVQFSTKSWLELRGEAEKWKGKFIATMDEEFPLGEYENWTKCQKLFPHVEKVLEYRPANQDYLQRWASILFNAGRWHWGQIYKMALGPEHPSTLSSMANLAFIYWNQGRWKEAEELEVLVMETRKTVLGQEHPDTLSTMNNLASTYRKQGRWKEAEELQAKELEICQRVLGEEHPDSLISMNNLALTYGEKGRWKEAEELQVRVIETRKTVLGQEHPDTLTSMNNLASTYGDQGRWKEAEELQVLVMGTRKTVLGQEHPSTLTSMNNLASTYGEQGRWKEAEELQAKELEICQRVLGEEHPDTLRSMANLASTYRKQGRWKEAEELQAKDLEIYQRVLGEEHPDTLISMNNLAFIFKDQGRAEDAMTLMGDCTRIQKRVLGPDHPYTTDSQHILNKWRMENSSNAHEEPDG
ncbi:TPR-like protein [Elaphomyces granulatus]